MSFTPEDKQKYINDLKDSIKEDQQSEKDEKRKHRHQEVEARRQKAEQWTKEHPWISVIITFVLIAAAIWFIWGIISPEPTEPTRETQIPSYEIIEINAGQLYQEYDNNEIAADLKYEGKMLKVSGIVDNVGEDILGNPYVVIVGDEDDWWGVQCTYPNTQAYRELLAKLNTGESVTVTGRCEGYLFNVLLEHH